MRLRILAALCLLVGCGSTEQKVHGCMANGADQFGYRWTCSLDGEMFLLHSYGNQVTIERMAQ